MSARVGLLVTCLMNVFRPNIGLASVKLLRDAECEVDVPLTQTCCGQIHYNSGDFDGARDFARKLINIFSSYDYVVAPSGSCIATVQAYPKLFEDEPVWLGRATQLAAKSFELVSFLTDVRQVKSVNARYDGIATYHDSCSGLRKLNIKEQPRQLLASVQGLTLKEMPATESCCGFGGTFCAKYPEISERLVDDKLANIQAAGATTLLGGDLGCLLNIAGRASRRGIALRVFHTAEVLAGLAEGAGIIGRGDAL